MQNICLTITFKDDCQRNYSIKKTKNGEYKITSQYRWQTGDLAPVIKQHGTYPNHLKAKYELRRLKNNDINKYGLKDVDLLFY